MFKGTMLSRTIDLKTTFNNGDAIREGNNFDELFAGLTMQPSQAYDVNFAEDVSAWKLDMFTKFGMYFKFEMCTKFDMYLNVVRHELECSYTCTYMNVVIHEGQHILLMYIHECSSTCT
jgi:hypothetical protein